MFYECPVPFSFSAICFPFYLSAAVTRDLDPSSGSVLSQIILGGVAGFFVLLKIYWRRIRRALGLYKEDSHPENVSDE